MRKCQMTPKANYIGSKEQQEIWPPPTPHMCKLLLLACASSYYLARPSYHSLLVQIPIASHVQPLRDPAS